MKQKYQIKIFLQMGHLKNRHLYSPYSVKILKKVDISFDPPNNNISIYFYKAIILN
jgi:hypothetical protein